MSFKILLRVLAIFKPFHLFSYRRPAEVDGNNETAFIMSTSGSTGPAKGRKIHTLWFIFAIICENSLFCFNAFSGFCVSHAYLFTCMHSIYVNMYKDGVIFNPSTLSWIIGVMTGNIIDNF